MHEYGMGLDAALAHTPRQMSALLFVASKRHRAEVAEALSLNAMAARGEPKALQKAIKDFGSE